MYTIAVCDDEEACRKEIIDFLYDIKEKEQIPCQICEFEKAEELLQEIESGVNYHLLILDVLLNEMSGMDLARALRKSNDRTHIIFVSSNIDMALYGYEVDALRFLAKPLDPVQFKEAILYCYKKYTEKKEILVQTSKGRRRISINEIMYAEAWERGTRLYMVNELEDVNMKISEFVHILPEKSHIQCHRSYLVNLAFVQYIKQSEIELKNGTCIPISKYRISDVRKKFIAYLEE